MRIVAGRGDRGPRIEAAPEGMDVAARNGHDAAGAEEVSAGSSPAGGSTAESEADALARLYDLDLRADPGDVDLYLALATRTGGPILELAAGTGRIAVPLAQAGHEVVGVDTDPAMLARARARAERAGADAGRRLRLLEADLVGLALPDAGRYRLAFIALNSITLLGDRAGQREAFRTMARHLAPGGLAVVDVWLPDGDDLARFDGRLSLESQLRDPDTGRIVVKLASAVHDPITGTVELTQIWDEGAPGESPARWLRSDRLRLVDADDLRSMAVETGFAVETLAGGYDLEPISGGAERAVLIAVRLPG